MYECIFSVCIGRFLVSPQIVECAVVQCLGCLPANQGSGFHKILVQHFCSTSAPYSQLGYDANTVSWKMRL